jgi:uncharacterized membrane protein
VSSLTVGGILLVAAVALWGIVAVLVIVLEMQIFVARRDSRNRQEKSETPKRPQA